MINGSRLVEDACSELGVQLADVIALASVWVSPEVYALLTPVGGVWYPQRRRANLGLRVDTRQVEAVGQVIDGVTLDSNTYANVAFKRSLGVDRTDFVGFHVYHIWPGTAYDPACYSNIANLVAIPAELSSLTDHHPNIVACLKYRAWELYRWKPPQESVPARPERYPERWREPWPATDQARLAASRRARDRSVPMREEVGRTSLTPLAGTPYLSARDATDAALMVAFYLSKFDHERLGIGNQGETIDYAARAVGVNRDTLKNYRDYYDSHTGSRRQGWKRPLPPQLQSPFAALMRMDEMQLRARVLDLLRAKRP